VETLKQHSLVKGQCGSRIKSGASCLYMLSARTFIGAYSVLLLDFYDVISLTKGSCGPGSMLIIFTKYFETIFVKSWIEGIYSLPAVYYTFTKHLKLINLSNNNNVINVH